MCSIIIPMVWVVYRKHLIDTGCPKVGPFFFGTCVSCDLAAMFLLVLKRTEGARVFEGDGRVVWAPLKDVTKK